MSFSLFLSLEYASSPDFKRALEKTDRRAIKGRERERDRRRAGVSTTTPTPDDDDDARWEKASKYLHTKRIGFGRRLLHSRALPVRSFLVTHTRTHEREREREREREEKDLASRTGRGVNDEYVVVR